MPHNGSGGFTLSDEIEARDPLNAEPLMAILQDLAVGVANSVHKDGQTPITGPVKFADGSAASPGITTGTDTNTGFYRISPDTWGFSAGGTLRFTFSTTALTMASGVGLAVPGFGMIPSGGIIMWSGTIATIPSGWHLCNGSNGTPDLRERFIIGASQDDTAAKTNVTGALTQTGGSKDAVNVSHTHTATVTDPGHDHTTNVMYTSSGGGGSIRQWYGRFGTLDVSGGPDLLASSSSVTGITVSNSTEGSSGTNANLPPYYALAFIMKA